MSTQSLWVEIDGQRMHCLKAGSGPPLLLVHGLLGGSFSWRFNVPVLSQRYTVYAVDALGAGLSDADPQTDCSMARQAVRLAEFVEKVGIRNEEFRVIASSWGGAVALLFAAQECRVRSLILCAPVNPWSQYGSRRVRFLSSATGRLLFHAAMPFSRPLYGVALRRMYGDPERIPEGTLEGYVPLTRRPGRPYNLLNTMRHWRRDLALLPDAIAKISAPTLLVWGTRDMAVDLGSCFSLEENLENGEHILLPGVGHLPFEEAPDEFNSLALEFFENDGLNKPCKEKPCKRRLRE